MKIKSMTYAKEEIPRGVLAPKGKRFDGFIKGKLPKDLFGGKNKWTD